MWQARPIFISSTFEDFQAERDHLRNHVFPALEERLRQHQRRLEWVDLRIGLVSDETNDARQRELEILKVCLTEVERCRPFMLVLLGDRYGWVPETDRVRIAAREAELNLDKLQCSVTELEILKGAFGKAPARVLFCFREPFDYQRMASDKAAVYSSRHKGDNDGAKRLDGLKKRIESKFHARIRRYRASWDEERQCPTGLEAWGRTVLEDIWKEFADEAGSTLRPSRTGHELECDALEEFIEDRARDLIGRDRMLSQLARGALDQTCSLGVCLIGEPGAGKSALFAALVRNLAGSQALVLAHAAGASPTAGTVNAMLRRWIEELGARRPATDATDATIQSAFAEALTKAASRRRVVVLIDALDQFEPTAAARHFAWAPASWPANVRLIVTGAPSDPVKAVSALPGIATLQLAPLTAADARDVIKSITARYHRQLEPAVLSALADKKIGSPLWLVLAAEEINLIDADDLARAKRNYGGDPAAQLRAMLVDSARALPSDIPGLYRATFAHAEAVFGAALVQAFLAMIAVSRGGWREHDFSVVIPRLSGEAWDSLRFAGVRRLFRGQMRSHGPMQQWDFAHAQMRAAALGRLSDDERNRAHAAICDHLLELDTNDPLRISEVMTHLLASKDWPRAARVIGDFETFERTRAPLEAASQTLIEAILAAPDSAWVAGIPEVTQILLVADERDRYRAAQSFQYEVLDKLFFRDALDLARCLRLHQKLHAVFWTLQKDVFGPPFENDLRWYSHVSAAEGRIAQDYLKLGDHAAAEPLLRAAVKTGNDLVRVDPDYAEWRRDLSVSYNNLGRFLRDRGDAASALDAFKRGLEELQNAIKREPQPNWQRDLAISERLVAEMQMRTGDTDEALAASKRAGAVTEKLAREKPDDVARQVDLAVEYSARSDRLVIEGQLTDAEHAIRSALDIRERVQRLDPRDGANRRNLARGWRKLGDILSLQTRPADALEALYTAERLARELAASDPANTEWTSDAASIGIDLASKLAALDQVDAADRELKAAETQIDSLLGAGGSNPILIEYKAQAQTCTAEIHERRKDYAAAEAALRAAVDTRRRRMDFENGRDACTAVAMALVKLGDLLSRRDNRAATERVLAEALMTIDLPSREDPRNVNLAQLAASVLGRLGEIKGAMGAHQEALALFRSSWEKLEQASAAAPELTGVRKNLAVSTFNIGYAYFSLGYINEAAEWQQRAIEMLQPITNDERDKAQLAIWRIQLFETKNRRVAASTDPAEQEAYYRQHLRALESEYGPAPEDRARRYELLEAYKALRAIQAKRGDLDGVQHCYDAIRRLET